MIRKEVANFPSDVSLSHIQLRSSAPIGAIQQDSLNITVVSGSNAVTLRVKPFFGINEKQKRRPVTVLIALKSRAGSNRLRAFVEVIEAPCQTGAQQQLPHQRKKKPHIVHLYMCVLVCVLVCFVHLVYFSRVGYRGDQCQGRFISLNAVTASAELSGDTGLSGVYRRSTSTVGPSGSKPLSERN